MSNHGSMEIADIFRRHGPGYRAALRLSVDKLRVMGHIERCRSEALGGHKEVCSVCGEVAISYNSCRDRHCPKCQTLAKEQWLAARKSELLPCGYFHLVFTLPHALNCLIIDNMAVMLGLLFSSVNRTLTEFALHPRWRLNGRIGGIAVLHTWNQQILDHFHLHCLIPAGALTKDQLRFVPARRKFLFRTDSLAKRFRNHYLDGLETSYTQGKLTIMGENAIRFPTSETFGSFIEKLGVQPWIVYAKAPFAGPEQVIEYLGRYTHRVAISNNRIKDMDEQTVTFSYRDRRLPGEPCRNMTIKPQEFIRRFLLHVLPPRFMKIRYFGFLAHNCKNACLAKIRKILSVPEPAKILVKPGPREIMMRVCAIDISLCRKCGRGKMVLVEKLPAKPIKADSS